METTQEEMESLIDDQAADITEDMMGALTINKDRIIEIQSIYFPHKPSCDIDLRNALNSAIGSDAIRIAIHEYVKAELLEALKPEITEYAKNFL